MSVLRTILTNDDDLESDKSFKQYITPPNGKSKKCFLSIHVMTNIKMPLKLEATQAYDLRNI